MIRRTAPNGGGRSDAGVLMTDRSTRDHWNRVYSTKQDEDVSWFEPLPEQSIRMLEAAGVNAASCVVDIGGGNSRLVDHLIGRGLTCLTVLDVSAAALESARGRLGEAALVPVWVEADVTGDWSISPVDIWHDRAVFHFLTTPDERTRYVEHLVATLKPGGSAVVATFALDGPERCSGLPVARYSPETLAAALGSALTLVDSIAWRHATPFGTTQPFQYSIFRRA
jgi:SAM-dependent methyltransferase